MNIQNTKIFILPNRLAAVSAVMLGNSIVATDGITPRFHIFDMNGVFIDSRESNRPYRKLRAGVNGFTALDGTTNRVYLLDDNMNEYCYITLENENDGCIVDASVGTIGDESFIIGAFGESVYLYSFDGSIVRKLAVAEKNERITDFISLGVDNYILASEKFQSQLITLSENGNNQTTLLDQGLHLRQLIVGEGGEVYGLFGKNYIYNRIDIIYSGGCIINVKKGCE